MRARPLEEGCHTQPGAQGGLPMTVTSELSVEGVVDINQQQSVRKRTFQAKANTTLYLLIPGRSQEMTNFEREP